MIQTHKQRTICFCPRPIMFIYRCFSSVKIQLTFSIRERKNQVALHLSYIPDQFRGVGSGFVYFFKMSNPCPVHSTYIRLDSSIGAHVRALSRNLCEGGNRNAHSARPPEFTLTRVCIKHLN